MNTTKEKSQQDACEREAGARRKMETTEPGVWVSRAADFVLFHCRWSNFSSRSQVFPLSSTSLYLNQIGFSVAKLSSFSSRFCNLLLADLFTSNKMQLCCELFLSKLAEATLRVFVSSQYCNYLPQRKNSAVITALPWIRNQKNMELVICKIIYSFMESAGFLFCFVQGSNFSRTRSAFLRSISLAPWILSSRSRFVLSISVLFCSIGSRRRGIRPSIGVNRRTGDGHSWEKF